MGRLWCRSASPQGPLEVDQSEADAQPVMVLVDSPISDLVETEDVLQYSEGMFYFGPDARLGTPGSDRLNHCCTK